MANVTQNAVVTKSDMDSMTARQMKLQGVKREATRCPVCSQMVTLTRLEAHLTAACMTEVAS